MADKSIGCFVKSVWSENTGGGTMVDFVELSDGRVLTVSDDCVMLRDSAEAFYDESKQDVPSIVFAGGLPHNEHA